MPHPQLRLNIGTDLGRRLLRRVLGGLCLILAAFATVWLVFLALNPNGPDPLKQLESEQWIATSKSWFDRVSCHNFGICGGISWLLSTHLFRRKFPPNSTGRHFHGHDWIDENIHALNWSSEEQELRKIPSYVLEYAPMLYLHRDEQWWPSDVADFLHHVEYQRSGRKNLSRISLPLMESMITGGSEISNDFLQSTDDPESLPDWLTSPQNIPTATTVSALAEYAYKADDLATVPCWDQSTKHVHEQVNDQSPLRNTQNSPPPKSRNIFKPSGSLGLRSAAPAFLITVKKNNDTVDAFWFFFYAFNRGARVAGIQYGNHVGDWEHIMIRFQGGKPSLVYLSAHEWGSAYKFGALEKVSGSVKRIIAYAGFGSHAHYATTGRHSYALPMGLLGDDCSAGYLWDPTLNLNSYVYISDADGWPEAPKFRSSMLNPRIRSSWLEYKGHWGNRKYALGDRKRRNYRFAGEYKYLSGPTGPWDKNLDRIEVCEHPDKPCIVREERDGYVGPIKSKLEMDNFGS